MTSSKLGGLAGALLLTGLWAAPGASEAPKKASYSIKVVADAPAPKEVEGAIRKLLGNRCVQLFDAKDALVAEVWLRKEVPVKATEEQVKNGLTYREVPSSTVLGAVRVPHELHDYRKERLAAGTYTLRLAVQPMTGDHAGTAPYTDFGLLSPAAADRKAGLMDAKALQEMSAKSTGDHPAVLLLFPGKGAAAEPALASRPGGHWVLLARLDALAGTRKAKLEIGLVLIGASASR